MNSLVIFIFYVYCSCQIIRKSGCHVQIKIVLSSLINGKTINKVLSSVVLSLLINGKTINSCKIHSSVLYVHAQVYGRLQTPVSKIILNFKK